MKTKFTFVLLLLLFAMGQSFAQVLLNTAPVSYQPSILTQGGAPGTYRMDVVNNNAVTVSGATFTLTLPAGMEYVSGSIASATESNISNLQKPVFTLNNILAGSTLTVTFNARINCGFTGGTISYATTGTNATASATSPVAGNTPAPAFVFSSVPSPQALSLPLKTNGTRTIKFKNTGNVSVSTVYFDTNVVTGTQYPYYKLLSSNFGTVAPITNGYRITLTGAALQSAITTSVGGADASFDGGEEITLVLTEQMTSCSLGSSIQLNMKAGSGDSKNNFCFFDSSTASITTPVGNAAISLSRVVGTTYPDFCNNGKVSYTIGNTGSGAASSLYNIKLPWSLNTNNAGVAPTTDQVIIKKVSLNGTDITSQVLTRNGTGSSALISGLSNSYVINLAGLTSAYGSSLQSLDGDGKYDDLPAGQTFQLDFEYGFQIQNFTTCRLNTDSNFSLGTSYYDQCGNITNRISYPTSGGSTYPTFIIGSQNNTTFSANLSVASLFPGDKVKLTISSAVSLLAAYQQSGKILKVFTIVLPDGLDYDSTGTIKYMNNATGTVIPQTAISYNSTTKTLVLSPSAALTGITASNDILEIPLVVSDSGTVTNKTVQYNSTLAFVGCPTVLPYSCTSSNLNYAIISGSCSTVATNSFDMIRNTFGYIPAPSNTNVWYMPTGFVNESTPNINLHGAVSKDKVKTIFKGIVNSTSYSELWARVKYTSNLTSNLTLSNFDKLSANAADIAGTITITKASDGSTISGNITVGDLVFSYDSGTSKQIQQVNLGAKIGAGKDINYTLQIGDKIEVIWFTKVSRDNLSFTYSQLQNLEGDLYTKDAVGTESGCQAIPVGFAIQRLNVDPVNNPGIQTIVGNSGLRVVAGIINGNSSLDISGDHFPNEVRDYSTFRSVQATIPGVWVLDTSLGKVWISTSGNVASYTIDPSKVLVTYSGGNTIISMNNDPLGFNGMPLSTATIPVVADNTTANGNIAVVISMLPVCATAGNVPVAMVQSFDRYTTAADNSNTESNFTSTFNAAGSRTLINYTANASPTLQNVDGIGSTVNWQVTISNTSDTAAIIAAGGSADLPNNWMSFVAPNNNITVTRLINTATNAVYPVETYGDGKYWVKLGNITTTATFRVEAHYSACSNDKLQVRYGFGTTGYPMNPDVGYGAELGICPANEKNFELNLLPKDIGITVDIAPLLNPVQFCTNPLSGTEHMIDYSLKITNTGSGNAENLILEAAFPQHYIARSGTSQLNYNGTTKTIGDPVFNTTKGVWQWYISADPNGIPFLPGASNGVSEMILSYQGETSCGFVSGSPVSYNMRATSGCGQLREYAASGDGMELSMVPSSLNSYFLTPSVVELKNDGSGAVYKIEIKNQGSNPISSSERIYVTVPSSVDYLENSVVRIIGSANVLAPLSNDVVGNIRILTFPLPYGPDGVNLNTNETASFSIQLKIVNAGGLSCGTIANAIKLESIYSVPDVTCGTATCPVNFITGKASSNAIITKTSFAITPTSGIAKFATTVNNNGTIKYTVTNTGTIANSTPIVVDFFNDINGDGLYTGTEPILYTQTISGADANLAAGATTSEQTTGVFTISETVICNVAAAIRLVNNTEVCTDAAVKIPVEFQPAVTDFTVCKATNVTIGNISNGAAVTWSPSTYLSDANISNPVFNYNGPALTAVTDFTYTATVAHAAGCTSTYTTTVRVNPDPVVIVTNPAAVCSGTSVDITAAAVTAGSDANLAYTYFADAAGSVNLINANAITATGVYYIKGTNANGCYTIAPVTVTINPLPTAYIGSTGPVCKGDATAPVVSFTGANGTPPYTFTYNIGGGSNLTVSTIGSSSIADVPVSTAAAGSFVYNLVSVKDSSISACEQPQTGTATVVVNPLPEATISGTAQVCHNGTAPQITFTGSGGTAPYTFIYKINGGDDHAVTTSGSNTATVPAPTDVTGDFVYTLVSVKDDSATECTQAQTGTATITVKELPTAVISGAAEVCKNGTSPLITFTGANGTAPFIFKYTINGGAEQSITTLSGNSVTVAAPTNAVGEFEYALVSVRENSACENLQSGSAIIKVNELPTATISGTDEVCQNEQSPNITFRGAGGVTPYTFTYKINGGDDQTISTAGGSTVSVPVPTEKAGSFIYSLVKVADARTEACEQLQSGFATVTVNPTPTVAITNPAAVCSGANVDLTAAAVTAGSTGVSSYAYYEDLAGTSVLADPTAVTASGTYYIQGTSSAGCKSAMEPVEVTVNPTPTVVITNPAAVCSGASVDLTAAAVTAGSTGVSSYAYYEDLAGTSVLADPTAVTASGTYYIQGTSSAGCKSAMEPVEVTVNPTPTVVITNPAAVCSGTSVDLTAAAVTAGSTAGLTYAYFTDAAGTSALAAPSAVTAGIRMVKIDPLGKLFWSLISPL